MILFLLLSDDIFWNCCSFLGIADDGFYALENENKRKIAERCVLHQTVVDVEQADIEQELEKHGQWGEFSNNWCFLKLKCLESHCLCIYSCQCKKDYQNPGEPVKFAIYAKRAALYEHNYGTWAHYRPLEVPRDDWCIEFLHLAHGNDTSRGKKWHQHEHDV